ncbi:unnamed protein product [Rotaria sp. Silwood1]|nr:unnamed protein product [Rotaria sp. Silwood1]
MFCMRLLLNFILLHFIFATPQINLHYTEWISESENNTLFQLNCLRVPASIDKANVSREIISYCMNDLSSKFHIENNNIFPKFTFVELLKQNITSQQLYIWLAPINIVERYQFYLNQLSTYNDKSLETQIFYNCTLPRFGSTCQYEIIYYNQNHLSLYEIIHDYYHTYKYNPTNFTCYSHLQCNRGPFPACLDWSEICNGQLDCLDSEFDEEHCWQLEINQCNDNEYQCTNGQCIPQSFFRDDSNTPDCVDGSDEPFVLTSQLSKCSTDEPSFECEERTCQATFLTTSCWRQRGDLLLQAIYSTKDNSTSEQCWSAFKCILKVPSSDEKYCSTICQKSTCLKIIQNTCPDMFYIPNFPIFFRNIYMAHTKNDSLIFATGNFTFPYVCYNNSRYDEYFSDQTKILFKNRTCFRPSLSRQHLFPFYSWTLQYFPSLYQLFDQLKKYNTFINYTSEICNRTNMYQCVNSSKCISVNHFMDGNLDCPQKDDEDIMQINSINMAKFLKNHFKCNISNKYLHHWYVQDGYCHCPVYYSDWCEDEHFDINYAVQNISFQSICNGFTQLIPINIEGTNETDETECQQWPCNNIYTHCDDIWHCPNGEDEIGCDLSSTLNCFKDHHKCVSPDTNQLICLPVEKANDGKIDCLGATDEPIVCKTIDRLNIIYKFYCDNKIFNQCNDWLTLCDGIRDCDHGEDEQFCVKNRTNTPLYESICASPYSSVRSAAEQFLCQATKYKRIQLNKYFSLDEMSKTLQDQTKIVTNSIFSSSSIMQISYQHKPRCHRGFDLRVWLNDATNLTTNTCLCPPSFYGDQCQYQNQRVSLTVRFQAFSDSWSTIFAIIISLIDDSDERIIHSYEQITYLSIRDCKVKFNIYLLYATQPKDPTKNYAIHIDIYEKISLNYRGSLLFQLTFPFLPVHRLAFIVGIPQKNEKIQSCSNSPCVNGKCIIYSNNVQNASFCQCNQGWSGRYCTIPHTCTCSSDSIYVGVSTYNRSVCVCPINKFGYQCLLIDTICQMNNNLTCQHDGKCIPADDYTILNKKFQCICPKGYMGDRCEIVDNKIILSFDNNIVLSQSIFIHFIEIINNDKPKRTTTFRTIPFIQNSLIIYRSRPFHLVFIELYNKIYYLAIIQKTSKQSTTINTMINPSDRCLHINELFNETIVKMHALRRIKYYHLPCQRYSSNFSCFYDDVYICLCYDYRQQRLANCFEFDHNMKFDCFGQSVCENQGQCFQDSPDCPERSTCICRPCFYGAQCQFSSTGFGLSLDAIIGYHIQPHINLVNQPNLVKISFVLSIIFIVVGLINGILSLITFKSRSICEIGCGFYLLSSSITTLLTTFIFGLKFCILLLAQMTIISNRLFLQIQCLSLDFLLRVCLNMDQWLNAFVAIERTVTIIKATNYNKKNSIQIAKIVIVFLLIFIISTNIYDPIYRRLIDEENEDDKRLWCIALYPSNLQVFNSIIHTFHFLTPFVINLVSVFILITKISRQQSNIHTNRTYIEYLKKNMREHTHLFIAPVILVILGIPRLIISFVSKCMKSTNDAWLFLIGYFMSFIPPLLTFVIFILPSKFYKQELHKSLISFRTIIQRYL